MMVTSHLYQVAAVPFQNFKASYFIDRVAVSHNQSPPKLNMASTGPLRDVLLVGFGAVGAMCKLQLH